MACDRLLNYRVEAKVAGKRINDVLNRIHIAMPKQRDNSARPPVIPPGEPPPALVCFLCVLPVLGWDVCCDYMSVLPVLLLVWCGHGVAVMACRGLPMSVLFVFGL